MQAPSFKTFDPLVSRILLTRFQAFAFKTSTQFAPPYVQDTKTQLEREQEEIVRMHQGFAQQKMAIAGAAGAGMGVGGLGMSMDGGMMGGGGGGMHMHHQQRRPQNLALPAASITMMNGMGGRGFT